MNLEIRWKRIDGSAIFGGEPTSLNGSEFNVAIRLNFLTSVAGDLNQEMSLIDIGCGYGGYLRAASELVGYPAGVEAVQNHIDRCKSLNIVRAIGEKIPFAEGMFDIALLIEVLEHVKDDRSVLKEARRILKLDGFALITVPNKFHPFETHGFAFHGRTFGNIFGLGVPFLSFFPRRVRKNLERARIYSQKDLAMILEASGFDIVAISYIPPQFNRLVKSGFLDAVRHVLFALGEHIPFKQMGVTCMVIAKPKEC